MAINSTEKAVEITGKDTVTKETSKVAVSSLGLAVDDTSSAMLLQGILTELRIGNAYLAMLTGEDLTRIDIEGGLD